MGAILVAALVSVALALPSIAGAHYWVVEGKALAAGKANGKEVELVSNSTIVFTLVVLKYQVQCETLSYAKAGGRAVIWNETKGSAVVGRDEGLLNATKCSDLTKPSCKVVEPISNNNGSEMSTTLVEEASSKKIYDMFLPEGWVEGTTVESEKELLFWTFDETGSGCVTGVPIEGDGLAAELSNEGEERETHTIMMPGRSSRCHPVGPPPASVTMANGNSIKLHFNGSGSAAEECGEGTVRLVSKEHWSVK